MSDFWQRLIVAAVVVCASTVAAKLVDGRIARRGLPPEAVTRYRVLRRSVVGAIVFIGVLSALLEIPQVRAIVVRRRVAAGGRRPLEGRRGGYRMTLIPDTALMKQLS